MSGSYCDFTLFVLLKHLIGVAVVSRNKKRAVIFFAGLDKPCKTQIHRLDTNNRGVHISGMSYHISVRIVASDKIVFLRLDSSYHIVGNLCWLHPGTLVKWHPVWRYLVPGFKFLGKFFRFISVPEISYMTVFLSFRNRIAAQPVLYQHLRKSVGDLGRTYKIIFRKIKIPVILKHAGIHYLRIIAAFIKFIEIRLVKRHWKLDSSVAAEVEQDYAVVITYLSNRGTVFTNNKRRKILVDSSGFLTQNCISLCRCGEHSALTLNMSIPAQFDHIPVSLVSVHCYFHSSAAGSYLSVEAFIVKRSKTILKILDISHTRGGRNVSSIQQNVTSYLGNALLFGSFYHYLQMRNIWMNISVRKQSDKMHCRLILHHICYQWFPCIRAKHFSAFNGLVYKLCALRINLSAAKSVMTNLWISHIVVRRQTYGVAVSFERSMWILFQKHIEGRGVCLRNCVAKPCLGKAYTVHNYKYYRFFSWHSF